MITRPLELASRLRPAPRNFDALFWVNAGLLVVFFLLFGSRFVLAPGLGLDFMLPQVAGADAGAARTTDVISVARPGLIFTDKGALDMRQLRGWLQARARSEAHPVLLIRASAGIPVEDITDITSAAHAAGFKVMLAATEPGAGGRPAAVLP